MCPGCGTKFYDLGRVPVTCPGCGVAVATEPTAKARGGAGHVATPQPKPDAAPEPAKVTPKPDDTDEPVAREPAQSDDKEGKQDLIEDVRELGEDEDDMAEVLEATIDKDDEA